MVIRFSSKQSARLSTPSCLDNIAAGLCMLLTRLGAERKTHLVRLVPHQNAEPLVHLRRQLQRPFFGMLEEKTTQGEHRPTHEKDTNRQLGWFHAVCKATKWKSPADYEPHQRFFRRPLKSFVGARSAKPCLQNPKKERQKSVCNLHGPSSNHAPTLRRPRKKHAPPRLQQ